MKVSVSQREIPAVDADLVAVHQESKSFSVENQIKTNSPIPWHPGAVK